MARSAIAPLTSAAVMIANVNWKVAYSNSGTAPCVVSGVMPSIPKCRRLPTSPLIPSWENAIV